MLSQAPSTFRRTNGIFCQQNRQQIVVDFVDIKFHLFDRFSKSPGVHYSNLHRICICYSKNPLSQLLSSVDDKFNPFDQPGYKTKKNVHFDRIEEEFCKNWRSSVCSNQHVNKWSEEQFWKLQLILLWNPFTFT